MHYLFKIKKKQTNKKNAEVSQDFYLSHFASIEKVFYHQKIQFLLCVVLGVLVTDSVNAKDLCQCRWPLSHRDDCYSSKPKCHKISGPEITVRSMPTFCCTAPVI